MSELNMDEFMNKLLMVLVLINEEKYKLELLIIEFSSVELIKVELTIRELFA